MGVRQRSGQRGGARPGAGRPRVLVDPKRLAIDVEREDLDALEVLARRQGASVAGLVRKAVRQFVNRNERRR